MRMAMIRKAFGAILSLFLVFFLLLLHQSYNAGITSSRNSAKQAFEYTKWLKQSEQEIKNMDSHPFNSSFKTPCWNRNGGLVCLPYFYLAGMPKCGTTDLWAKMSKHPHITVCGWNKESRSGSICRKEPHWWGKHRFEYGQTIENYFKIWARFAYYVNAGVFPAPKQIIGDGSASTFWQLTYRGPVNVPYNMSDSQEDTTAKLIRALQPNAKFIVIFRNPSERLYSQYNYQKKELKTPEHFHQSIEYSIKKAKECVRNMTKRECAYIRYVGEENLFWIPRIFLGWYDVFVSDWLNLFPRKQFFFVRLEDWKTDCVNILPKLFDFLSVDRLSNETYGRICDLKAENVNTLTKEKMLPQTKALLDEFYRPNLKRLALILNDDRFLWNG